MSTGDDGADPEDRDEYTAEGVFWVPPSARWEMVQAAAKQADIGKRIDNAMTEIERENPKPKGVLPKGYARPTLDQRRLGELVDLIGGILFERDTEHCYTVSLSYALLVVNYRTINCPAFRRTVVWWIAITARKAAMASHRGFSSLVKVVECGQRSGHKTD